MKKAPTCSCIPGKCFKVNKSITFTESPGTSLNAAFVLAPGVSEIPRKEYLRFSQLPGSPGYQPCWFSKPAVLGGSSLQCRSQRLGCPMWASNLSLLMGQIQTPAGGGVVVRLPLCPSFLSWPFYPLSWRSCSLVLSSFSGVIFPYGAVDLLCPLEMVSSGSSYILLGSTPDPSLKLLVIIFDHLAQWFSEFGAYQKHIKGLFKHKPLGPTQSF